MTRICVLGNSHAAAIALGWKTLQADYPGVSLTFFAAFGLVFASGLSR